MELIKETGVTQTSYYLPTPQGWTYCYSRVFYYTAVCWYDGFKFAFGSESGYSVKQMIEVSTGANAVVISEIKGNSKIEEKLFKKFLDKLKERNVCVGELVDNFNSKNNALISAWQNSLML